MKKSLLALAILGAFAGAASAQSSVTIYGIVDTGVAKVDNGGDSQTRLESGLNNSSRIGFKGAEDLGNGLKATFVLENGFNSDTGGAADSTAAFSRLSYVGLEGNFGAVRLGRQNSQMKTALSQIDPFETGGVVNAINFFTGGGIPERVSNQITYTSPTFSGFSGSVGYVFGEAADDNSANRGYGAQLGYANGPLNVQFGYNKQNKTQVDANAVVVPGGTDNDTNIYMLGATYDLGVVKLHGAYGQQKAEVAPGADDIKVKSALIGATVPFGASKIRAEYIRNNDDRDDHDSNLFALSYSYALSKRTTLYATYARTDNDDDAALFFTSNKPVPVTGENGNVFGVGIQHNF